MNNFGFYIAIGILLVLDRHLRVQCGSVTFCDGPNRMEKTREQCGAGITFGDTKPDCICVKGVYRFIADSCETADGFAEMVCTKLTDDNGMGASIVGVKFTKDPVNWSQTGVVCERKGFGSETWDFITEKNSRGSTSKSTNVYVLNGKAFMGKGHHDKPAFCVEPAAKPEDERICRYLKSENNEWSAGAVEIIVKSKCEGIPLKPHKCFGVLKRIDSECELTCSNVTVTTQGRNMGRALKDSSSSSKKGKAKEKVKVSGKSSQVTPSPQAPPAATDGTHPVDYWKYDNKYLNRKMIIYNLLKQLYPDKNDSSFGEPKRTFQLFEIMSEISQFYCDNDFVKGSFIRAGVNLFYILHKGNVFKYDETLSEADFEWINGMLNKCLARVKEAGIVMSSEATMDSPANMDNYCSSTEKATGYCNGTKDDDECNFKPIRVEPDRANDSYHYVPELAWDIVDLVQVACFHEFNESYRMFHVLEQAAEKLFTLQIKNLWYYPSWSTKIKSRLLGNNADLWLHNFEVCINSAYDMHLDQIPRLVRPGPTKYLKRKKRSAQKPPQSQGQFVDVYCSKSRKDFVAPSNCAKN